MTYVPNMIHICPNNLPLWLSVTKPQQTNEYMREVINHSTHTHLLKTIAPRAIVANVGENFWHEFISR